VFYSLGAVFQLDASGHDVGSVTRSARCVWLTVGGASVGHDYPSVRVDYDDLSYSDAAAAVAGDADHRRRRLSP